MKGPQVKGTVTSLSSVFPPEEAQKAAKRVQKTIAERQKEVDQLQEFISENTALVKLVQKLPDDLHHEIMVPFGKAAFFPGRLIHTNEFLVLLGEGYYAERTSKQTVDILNRRGKALESQIGSSKAVMDDLKVQASFFDSTATEAVEGLVEIREEYPEEAFSGEGSMTDNSDAAVKDEDIARMFSRIDELEIEEEHEAENVDEYDEHSLDPEVQASEAPLSSRAVILSEDEHRSGKEPSEENTGKDFPDQSHLEGSEAHPMSKDGSPNGENRGVTSNFTEKDAELSSLKENLQVATTPKNEAFTGSIIEHTHNIESDRREQKQIAGHISKPVSRFKMQRR